MCALDSLNQRSSLSWPIYTLLKDKALRLKTPDGLEQCFSCQVQNVQIESKSLE